MPHLDPWCDALCVYWVLGKEGKPRERGNPDRWFLWHSSCKRLQTTLERPGSQAGGHPATGELLHPSTALPGAPLPPVWALPAHSLSPMMSLSHSSHTRWLRLFSFSSCSILRGSAGGSRPWRSDNASNWSLPREFACLCSL